MSKTTTATRKASATGKPPAPAKMKPSPYPGEPEGFNAHTETCLDNAFMNASREMFEAVVEMMDWHVDQMRDQLKAMLTGDPKERLAQTADDARKVHALAVMLAAAAGDPR